MAHPTKKSPGDEAFLKAALGRSRVKTIRADLCVSCGGEANAFKDELSKREYTISGFCQVCQDKVWG